MNSSARISHIQRAFTKAWRTARGAERTVTPDKKQQDRGRVWQPRFWEHTCEDVDDFDIRFDYIHFNPVKHGSIACPVDWPHSSMHRWIKRGVLDPRWACGHRKPPNFQSIENESGEP